MAVKGKLFGKIWERDRGFFAWIRFGGKGLALWVENIEVCYVAKEGKSFQIDWEDSGRSLAPKQAQGSYHHGVSIVGSFVEVSKVRAETSNVT